MRYVIALLLLLIPSCAWAGQAKAMPVASAEKICDAIYLAENSLLHPYGIMVKYKHTKSRQACINTVLHRSYDWNVHAVSHFKYDNDFIVFLGSRYAPIGADNDPSDLNNNWVSNVKYFLRVNK